MWITTAVAVVLRLVVGVAVSAPVEVAVFLFFSPEALEGVPHGGGSLPTCCCCFSLVQQPSLQAAGAREEERRERLKGGVVLDKKERKKKQKTKNKKQRRPDLRPCTVDDGWMGLGVGSGRMLD
jgi:hypothetical protein